MSQEFFSVSELNKFIKDVLNSGFPQPVWICGEIQGYNRNRNKNHIFFELIEKDQDSKDVKSRISLVLFSGRKNSIQTLLSQSENAFSLKDDIEVKFLCKVDYYAPHGAVRLKVESIDPVYTLGKLAQEKQKLIALLRENGTLDKNKHLTVSPVPLKVGLITSDDSAACNDFLSELSKSAFGFKIFLRNTLMQGKKAEDDVCKAIKSLNGMDIDVIVITRGGGSISDLSCFDSRKIAEAVASSQMPVFSGIGHEINITITDLAAHTYAKTPTAIAQMLVNRVEKFINELDEGLRNISAGCNEIISEERQRIKEAALRLGSVTTQYLKEHNAAVIRWMEMLKHRPLVLIKDKARFLRDNRESLLKVSLKRILDEGKKIAGYSKIIEVVHPINTMKRGFSITRDKTGQVIRHPDRIKVDEPIDTELAEGSIQSIVRKIENKGGGYAGD